jgi:cytochrome c553
VLTLGQTLATKGDPSRGVPACAACHNPDFTGLQPGIPALVGLRPNYISAQLDAFRYGTRTAAAPDCMQLVAGRLTEADVTALPAWLSSLPAPAKPTPLLTPANTRPNDNLQEFHRGGSPTSNCDFIQLTKCGSLDALVQSNQ